MELSCKVVGLDLFVEDARKQRDAKVVEIVMGALDEQGVGDIIREHFAALHAAPPKRAQEPRPADEVAEPERRDGPKAKQTKGKASADPEWRRKILGDALHSSEGRDKLLGEIASKPITLPDGKKTTVGKSTLYKWISKLAKDDAAGKQATPDQQVGQPLQVAKGVDLSDVSKYRTLDCPAYKSCMAFSKSQGWRGFACTACPRATKPKRSGSRG